MMMKQYEYLSLTLLVYFFAYSLLTVAVTAQSSMIWYSDVVITLVQFVCWGFIGLGIACALYVMIVTLKAFIKMNSEIAFGRRYGRRR